MKKVVNNRAKYLKYGVVAVLIVSLVVVGFLCLLDWERDHSAFPEQEIYEEVLNYNGEEYVLKNDVETFLVMGLDKFEGTSVNDSYNNDQRADFIMLFVFDNELKKCGAIHINRDTMANVNVLGVAGNKIDSVKKQIALAHTYGNGKDVSCHNTADAVSELLMGIKVDHYASLALDSVQVINKLVGGVEVTVLDDFGSIDSSLIKGQTVTLTDEQALKYVRTRYGLEDSSNDARMGRQQQYINALYDKYMSLAKEDEEFVVKVSLEMAEYLVSDRSVTQLQDLAEKFSEYEFVGISDLDGESVVGEQFVEFYPDADSVTRTVVENFYEIKQ